jgi:hypothetical protein
MYRFFVVLCFGFASIGAVHALTVAEFAAKYGLTLKVKDNGEQVLYADEDFVLNEESISGSGLATIVFLKKLIVKGESQIHGANLVINELIGEEGKALLRVTNADGAHGTGGAKGADGDPPGKGAEGRRGQAAGPVDITLGEKKGVKLIVYARGGNGGNGGTCGIGGSDWLGDGGAGGDGADGGDVKIRILEGGNILAYGWQAANHEQLSAYTANLEAYFNSALTAITSVAKQEHTRLDEAKRRLNEARNAALARIDPLMVENNNIINNVLQQIQAERTRINKDWAGIQAKLNANETNYRSQYNAKLAEINWANASEASKAEARGRLRKSYNEAIASIASNRQQVQGQVNAALSSLNAQESEARAKLAEAQTSLTRQRQEHVDHYMHQLESVRKAKLNVDKSVQYHKARISDEIAELKASSEQLRMKGESSRWAFNLELLAKVAEAHQAKLRHLRTSGVFAKTAYALTEDESIGAMVRELSNQIVLAERTSDILEDVGKMSVEEIVSSAEKQNEVEEALAITHRIFVYNHGGLPGIGGFGRNPGANGREGKDGKIDIEVVSEESLKKELEQLLEEPVPDDAFSDGPLTADDLSDFLD